MEIKTYLPIFTGFYNTILQLQEYDIIYNINEDREENNLSEINFDHLEIDYKQYEIDICIKMCDVIKEKICIFVENIIYEKIVSPKEYNFKNDSVDVIIIPKTKEIKEYIYKNKNAFCEYLKNRYTSYDGFISHYSNNFDNWEIDTNNFTNFNINGHALGSILDFISINEDIEEINIFYDVTENISNMEYLENYDKLINDIVCSKCNAFVSEEIKNIADKYKKIMNKYPSLVYCDECLENL